MNNYSHGWWPTVAVIAIFAGRTVGEAAFSRRDLQVPAVWTPARRAEFERCVNALDPDAPDLAERITDCAGVAP